MNKLIYILITLFFFLMFCPREAPGPLHEHSCACDTCCYQGYVPVVNPNAPNYAD